MKLEWNIVEMPDFKYHILSDDKLGTQLLYTEQDGKFYSEYRDNVFDDELECRKSIINKKILNTHMEIENKKLLCDKLMQIKNELER